MNSMTERCACIAGLDERNVSVVWEWLVTLGGSNGYGFPLLCCFYYGSHKSILTFLWEAEEGK